MATTVLPRHSVKTRMALAMLAIFVFGLWSLCYYASQLLRKDMERLLGEQQFSTVSVVAAAIQGELNDRVQALELVAGAIDAPLLEDPDALKKTLEQLIVLKTIFNAGVHVVGRDGAAITEVSEAGRAGVDFVDNQSVRQALSAGKVRIGSPMRGAFLRQPVFPIVAPILDARGEVAGALIGSINLGQPNFLERITGGHYGKTGGYVLVAPEHRLIVTATDKTRVMEALPAPGSHPLPDRMTGGAEGFAVVRDTREGEVLVSLRRIPASDWTIAAVLPTAEAFAPIADMQRRMLLTTIILTVLAGVLTWWMIRRQLAPMLAAAKALALMSDTGQAPQALPIAKPDEIGLLIAGFNRVLATSVQRENALRLSERKLSDILEHADAYIYLKDIQGRYLFANRPVRELFGVALEGLVGQSDEQFFDGATVEQLRRNERPVLQEGKTLRKEETTRNLRDGRISTYLSVKLPLRNEAGEIYALCGLSTDITERKKTEEELRIAAIAFECQEGIVVLDAALNILRVNLAFSRITGYTQHDVQGRAIAVLMSDRYAPAYYAPILHEIREAGAWQGEMWLRNKNGENYLGRGTVAAVLGSESRQITHYVCNLTDATDKKLEEQQRLESEAAHRNLLVREVHHRIKNNLQGITGILRQFAQKYPAIEHPINQAIGQVQSISVIHGLHGREPTSSVRLCELTAAIAEEVQNLWRSPVTIDIGPDWAPCILAESEAVPVALILNELILNAVKHSDKPRQPVAIGMRKGGQAEAVQIHIRNSGRFANASADNASPHTGLQLIAALMPRYGARLVRQQCGDSVLTMLELEHPIILLDEKAQA